jgi:uncharacterized membrane protein
MSRTSAGRGFRRLRKPRSARPDGPFRAMLWRRHRQAVDDAVQLFERGRIDDAARLLRDERKAAKAAGRNDLRTEIDAIVLQMRAHLNREERKAFDALYKPPHLADEQARTPTDFILMPVAAASFFLYYLAGYLVAVFVAAPLWVIQRIVSGPARMRGDTPRPLKAKAAVDAWLERYFADPL